MKNIIYLLIFVCLITGQNNACFAAGLPEQQISAIKLEASKYLNMHNHPKFVEYYKKNALDTQSYYLAAVSLYEREAYEETIILLKIYLERTEKRGEYYTDAVSLLEKAEAEHKLQLEDEKKHSNVPSDYKAMVLVSSGTFIMGSSEKEIAKPAHTVSLNGYYIGKYEVIQKLWKEVMDYNPSMYIGNARPVDNVDWYDAVEFCNKLSIREGFTPCYLINKNKKDPNNKHNKTDDPIKWTVTCDFGTDGYRMPTEAEWEFAARGGNSSKGYAYSGSNNPADVAVPWKYLDENKNTDTVGSKKLNELGIYDITGNVNEWCWDWFSWRYYKEFPADNPKGADYSVEGRVARGGELSLLVSAGRVSNCGAGIPISRFFTIGFRLVRSEKPGD